MARKSSITATEQGKIKELEMRNAALEKEFLTREKNYCEYILDLQQQLSAAYTELTDLYREKTGIPGKPRLLQ